MELSCGVNFQSVPPSEPVPAGEHLRWRQISPDGLALDRSKVLAQERQRRVPQELSVLEAQPMNVLVLSIYAPLVHEGRENVMKNALTVVRHEAE